MRSFPVGPFVDLDAACILWKVQIVCLVTNKSPTPAFVVSPAVFTSKVDRPECLRKSSGRKIMGLCNCSWFSPAYFSVIFSFKVSLLTCQDLEVRSLPSALVSQGCCLEPGLNLIVMENKSSGWWGMKIQRVLKTGKRFLEGGRRFSVPAAISSLEIEGLSFS